MFSFCTRPPTASNWDTALSEASSSVVQLRISQPRDFGGEAASSSVASGFVVARGIICTNRHVVGVGPIYGDAVFADGSECAVEPLYRDPIHDFGFFAFKEDVDVRPLVLAPDGAKVGTEIRICGSDAGERLMMLPGTISRVDRQAPEYEGDFRDFDTFYIAAASSTSGGSSGSPVLDIMGRCVAINAGGAVGSSSAFFFPLDRVVVALDYVMKNVLRPPRGTLEVVFKHVAFPEAERLGLNRQERDAICLKTPRAFGVLVVDRILPGGSGFMAGLKEGDLLRGLNGGIFIPDFVSLETLLDDSVGKVLQIEVLRGGRKLHYKVLCKNLWDSMIDDFVEFSDGVFHAPSYQRAIFWGIELNAGIFVAKSGFAFGRADVGEYVIITKIGNYVIKTLNDFIQAIASQPDDSIVQIRYFEAIRKNNHVLALLKIDRHWFPARRSKRDTATGLWSFEDIPECPRSVEGPSYVWPLETTASTDTSALIVENDLSKVVLGSSSGEHPSEAAKERVMESVASSALNQAAVEQQKSEKTPERSKKKKTLDQRGKKKKNSIGMTKRKETSEGEDGEGGLISSDEFAEMLGKASLALVTFDVAHPIDGNEGTKFQGVGVVIDEKRGWLVCDRATVISRTGDVRVVFEGTVEVDGHVLFFHPTQNFCFVQFNVSQAMIEGKRTIGDNFEIVVAPFFYTLGAAAAAAPDGIVATSPDIQDVKRGDVLIFVGMTNQGQVTTGTVTVASLEKGDVATPLPPQFSAKNLETINFDAEPPDSLGGFFLNLELKVCALWTSFSFPLDMHGFGLGIAEQDVLLATSSGSVVDLYHFVLSNTVQSDPANAKWCSFGIEYGRLSVSEARLLGLSDEWVKKVIMANPNRKELLTVSSMMQGTGAAQVLNTGDVVLAVNDETKVNYREVDRCATRDTKFSVLRDGIVLDVLVPPVAMSLFGTTRVVNFAGLQLQETFEAVLFYYFPKELNWSQGKPGVYVSRMQAGSPAEKYQVMPLHWILEIDGVFVPNLDSFLDYAKTLKEGASIRMRVVNVIGTPDVVTLKLDLRYFPTTELKWVIEDGKWKSTVIGVGGV